MNPASEPEPRSSADGLEPLSRADDHEELHEAAVSHLRPGDRDYVAAFRRGLAPGGMRPDLATIAVRTDRGFRLHCDVAPEAFLQLGIGRGRIEVGLRDRDVGRIAWARELLGGLGVRWRPAGRVAPNGNGPRAADVLLRGSMPARGRKHRLAGFERIAALLPSVHELEELRRHLRSLFDEETVAVLLPRAARKGVLVGSWTALGGASRVRAALRPLLLEPLDSTGELGADGALRFGRKLLSIAPSLAAAGEEEVDARIREVFLSARDRGLGDVLDALRGATAALAAFAAEPGDGERARVAALAGRRLRSVGRSKGGGRTVLLAAMQLEEARWALAAAGEASGASWRQRLAWAARELVKATRLVSAVGGGAHVHERIARCFRTVREEEAAARRETASRRRTVLAAASSVSDTVEEIRALDRADAAAERLRAAAEELRELVRDRLAGEVRG